MTNHGVQALFDATWIGMTEIFAVRRALHARANIVATPRGPFPYLAISCTCRATWAGKLRLLSERQPPFMLHSSQSPYRFRTDRENSMKLSSAIVVASFACLIA